MYSCPHFQVHHSPLPMLGGVPGSVANAGLTPVSKQLQYVCSKHWPVCVNKRGEGGGWLGGLGIVGWLRGQGVVMESRKGGRTGCGGLGEGEEGD